MKLPVRLINTTNNWRLVQGHETSPMSVKEIIADASREVDNGGIGRRIGGIPELTTDTLTIADHRGIQQFFEGQGVGDNQARIVKNVFKRQVWGAKLVNLIIDSHSFNQGGRRGIQSYSKRSAADTFYIDHVKDYRQSSDCPRSHVLSLRSGLIADLDQRFPENLVVEDKATDYTHLKQALAEQFLVVINRSELETRFYASSQKLNQKPSDFVYDLFKIHKQLKLEMTEEKLLDHVISRLEPQILDYVEVRHPQTTSNLLQIIYKNEERFLNRKIRGSCREFRDTNQSSSNRFLNRNRQENWRETRGNNRYSDNSRVNSTDLKVKVFRIIGGSIVDAEVLNLIIDFIIKVVYKVVQGTVLSGVRMIKIGI
ncbi:uncharacterized protein TNCV_2432511 [Trichonephila clavipes]|nr:uncharacterized protein TNCV_2432511 [Trichonephila clavipes]